MTRASSTDDDGSLAVEHEVLVGGHRVQAGLWPQPGRHQPGRRARTYSAARPSSAGSIWSKGPSAGSTARPGMCAATLTPGASPAIGTAYQIRSTSDHSIHVGQAPAPVWFGRK